MTWTRTDLSRCMCGRLTCPSQRFVLGQRRMDRWEAAYTELSLHLWPTR